MKKKLFPQFFIAILMVSLMVGCKKDTPSNDIDVSSPGKIAYDWFNFQTDISKRTSSLGPGGSGRYFAYAGIALYESVVPGMSGYQSIYTHLTDKKIGNVTANDQFFWPACANAALARFSSKFLANTGAANLAAIDSMQALYVSRFQTETDAATLSASILYGQLVGDAIYDWSITDGSATPAPPYTVPTGPGMWIPTPPAFIAPIATNWGSYNTFVKNVSDLTQPAAPIAYATDTASAFYKEALEVYTTSLKLTHDDTLKARSWSNLAGNYNGQSHLTRVLTQTLINKGCDLQTAAIIYAQHGIAIADAAVSCFKTIYTYTRIRPVSYIRSVMGKPTWNPLTVTTPQPEYSSPLACITGASSIVLEKLTGNNYSFTDSTHASAYGSFRYNSISDYTNSAIESQILAGVHFRSSLTTGLAQGKKVGERVLELPFKK